MDEAIEIDLGDSLRGKRGCAETEEKIERRGRPRKDAKTERRGRPRKEIVEEKNECVKCVEKLFPFQYATVPFLGKMCGECILDYICPMCKKITHHPIRGGSRDIDEFCVYCLKDMLTQIESAKVVAMRTTCMLSNHHRPAKMYSVLYGYVCLDCLAPLKETVEKYLSELPEDVTEIMEKVIKSTT